MLGAVERQARHLLVQCIPGAMPSFPHCRLPPAASATRPHLTPPHRHFNPLQVCAEAPAGSGQPAQRDGAAGLRAQARQRCVALGRQQPRLGASRLRCPLGWRTEVNEKAAYSAVKTTPSLLASDPVRSGLTPADQGGDWEEGQVVTGVCYKGTDGVDHVASAHLTVGPLSWAGAFVPGGLHGLQTVQWTARVALHAACLGPTCSSEQACAQPCSPTLEPPRARPPPRVQIVCDGMYSSFRKKLAVPDLHHPSFFIGLLLKVGTGSRRESGGHRGALRIVDFRNLGHCLRSALGSPGVARLRAKGCCVAPFNLPLSCLPIRPPAGLPAAAPQLRPRAAGQALPRPLLPHLSHRGRQAHAAPSMLGFGPFCRPPAGWIIRF